MSSLTMSHRGFHRNLGLIAAAVSSASLLMTSTIASAAPHAKCVWYANEAVKAQKSNVLNNCGFVGFRWHAWRDGHYQWCRGQSIQRIDREIHKRMTKLLKRCDVF